MDKDYKLESLKATMKFLKTQDPSIKLASYNTKAKILDYLQSINYDMSQIKIKGLKKSEANKMFKFMAKGGSYEEPKKPQYSLAELKKVMKFLKTQDKSIRLLDYNSKKKILNYLQSINYDFSGIPQMVKDNSKVKLQLRNISGGKPKAAVTEIPAQPAAQMAAPKPSKAPKAPKPPKVKAPKAPKPPKAPKATKVPKVKAPKPPKKTKEQKRQESIRRQELIYQKNQRMKNAKN